MRINQNRKSGFTLVEIMIVVAIIGLLAAIAIPNFVKARTTAQKNACINNLRQIDGAKEQWALENKKTQTDTPVMTDLVGTDKYIKVTPTCPANGTYTLGNMSTKPTCSNTDHTLQ
jgi:prepilin-type N-terminal cleavage/methylation domain-containing protein